MDAPSFPRELYDIVVNHFHDDIPTLKKVALVDRSSAKICQSHLFRQITLRTRRTQGPTMITSTPCFKLHDILLSSPHLATRVKDLTVDNREPCDFDPDKYPFVAFVADDVFLPAVLDALQHITCITLLLDSPSWSNLALPLRASIEEAFASETLRDVTMLGVYDIPPSLFRASIGLHRLCLLHTTLLTGIDFDFHDHCQLKTLALIVDDPRELLDQPSPFNFKHLQKINISLGKCFRHHLQSLTLLLENNASTLEFLGLHIFEKPPSAQAINIGCLTSLRHLLIDIPTWLDRNMMVYLAHLIQKLEVSSSVETITIVIIVSEECTLQDWNDNAKWQALDMVFSRLTRAPLHEVNFQVHSNEGRLDDITGLDLIENGLPGLLSRGILKVEKIPDLPSPYIT